MLKAVNRSLERAENVEQLRELTSKIKATSSLEKRLKEKGEPAGIFTERKKELIKKVEEMRRG